MVDRAPGDLGDADDTVRRGRHGDLRFHHVEVVLDDFTEQGVGVGDDRLHRTVHPAGQVIERCLVGLDQDRLGADVDRGVAQRVSARNVDRRERGSAILDDRIVDPLGAEVGDQPLRDIANAGSRRQLAGQVDAHRLGRSQPHRSARQNFRDLDQHRDGERPDGAEIGHMHVVGLDEHAGLHEAHLDGKHVAVPAPSGIEKVIDAVFRHDFANLLLPFRRRRADRHGLVVGADENLVGVVKPLDAEFRQRPVEIDHIPVVDRDQLGLRVDDIAGRYVVPGHPRQDLFRYRLAHPPLLRRGEAENARQRLAFEDT